MALAWTWYSGLWGGAWACDTGVYAGPNPPVAPATLPGPCTELDYVVATGVAASGQPWTGLLSDPYTWLDDSTGLAVAEQDTPYGPGYPADAHYFLVWAPVYGELDSTPPYLTPEQVLAGEPWPQYVPAGAVLLGAAFEVGIATAAATLDTPDGQLLGEATAALSAAVAGGLDTPDALVLGDITATLSVEPVFGLETPVPEPVDLGLGTFGLDVKPDSAVVILGWTQYPHGWACDTGPYAGPNPPLGLGNGGFMPGPCTKLSFVMGLGPLTVMGVDPWTVQWSTTESTRWQDHYAITNSWNYGEPWPDVRLFLLWDQPDHGEPYLSPTQVLAGEPWPPEPPGPVDLGQASVTLGLGMSAEIPLAWATFDPWGDGYTRWILDAGPYTGPNPPLVVQTFPGPCLDFHRIVGNGPPFSGWPFTTPLSQALAWKDQTPSQPGPYPGGYPADARYYLVWRQPGTGMPYLSPAQALAGEPWPLAPTDLGTCRLSLAPVPHAALNFPLDTPDGLPLGSATTSPMDVTVAAGPLETPVPESVDLGLGTFGLGVKVSRATLGLADPATEETIDLGAVALTLSADPGVSPLLAVKPLTWAWHLDYKDGRRWVSDAGVYTGGNPLATPSLPHPDWGLDATNCYIVELIVADTVPHGEVGTDYSWSPFTTIYARSSLYWNNGWVQGKAALYGPGFPPGAHLYLTWSVYYTLQPVDGLPQPKQSPQVVLANLVDVVDPPMVAALTVAVTASAGPGDPVEPSDLGSVHITLQVAPSGLTPARGSLGEPYFVLVDGSESYDLRLCPFDASPPIVIGDPFAPSMWLSMKPMSDGILTVTMDAPFDAEMEAWVGPDYTDAPKFVRLIAWTGSEPVELTPAPLVIGFGMIADTADEAARLMDALVLSATMILV